MRVTVLVIVHDDVESITLHEDGNAASSSLKMFLETRWAGRFDDIYPAGNVTLDEFAKRFFAADGDFYIIAEADLSAIEAYLDIVAAGP